ncbi:DUF3558 family protein [Corynebacterium oculi]|uniref:DUF3558 domain-containing protein n=1 Tax=Corynebacterium oculi TaxID=1544416 RepID=A0A0Q0YRS8_9CORY|nr:DUF3558 family protein [Corynebacterium oculi]KQB85092.1 hypothetical protein Cocul_00227 [Corynebacterium oculi]
MRKLALPRLCALLCLLVLGGGGLAACSSSGKQDAARGIDDGAGTSSAVPVQKAEDSEVSTAPVAREGLPFEVGEWDVNDPNFRFFDPCTEIPADVFVEAGLGEMSGKFTFDEGYYSTCFFVVSSLEGGTSDI